MTIRVTTNYMLLQSLESARKHAFDVSRFQSHLSSGLKLQRPSDDPTGMRALLALRSGGARRTADVANIETVRTSLNVSVTNLQDAQNLFVQAKQIALQAQQATEPAEIEGYVQTIDSLLGRLLAIANAQHDGEYLYGGTRTDQPPFVQTGVSTDVAAPVQYVGSEARSRAAIGEGRTADRLYTGREVFLATERETPIFVGQTGAAAGSGTSSATGQDELIVRHTATTFAAGSGVQPGAGSATGDTIIGAAGTHLLTITDVSGTGAFGSVSLDGGADVNFTSSDTDLAVTGPFGDVVYLDMSAITPGFSGDVDVTADGTLSVDGGATVAPIDFSTNQAVTDSLTQSVTYIDGSGITRTGADEIDYVGAADAFQVLQNLRRDLLAFNNVPSAEWHAALQRRIGDIDRVHNQFLRVIGEQSVTLQQLDFLQTRSETLRLEGQTAASDLESADVAEAAVRLQQSQLLLQTAYAATVQVMNQSLLDFLK